MPSPWATQPPGKRTNRGCKSAMACAKSARKPFLRCLKVFCGKSEIMSSATLPVNCGTTSSFALSADLMADIWSSCFFQSPLIFFVLPSARISPDSLVKRTSKLPFSPSRDFAKTEKLYFSPWRTGIPANPLFTSAAP